MWEISSVVFFFLMQNVDTRVLIAVAYLAPHIIVDRCVLYDTHRDVVLSPVLGTCLSGGEKGTRVTVC